ncbi:FtsX-like permease family protein [Bifidobacterium sp. 82T24]|uniref:ABC transporter permease n=1 Tax=Bifidobacterium pluvialisilvae TaxID=2834436 RepID=UPI001C5863AC|nr:ABC transporter permease [Bifidobacterium pluvialisilvae]MBW3087832.1 FtsX-like permease family protein [Bifidobacterium pluvialisilvae]
MFPITLKLMRRNVRMLIPAGVAILIGTAFIAATFLFGNAMTDALARMTTAQYGDANYSIGPDTSLTDMSDSDMDYLYSRTVKDFRPDRIRAVDGVDGVRFESRVDLGATHGSRHASVFAVTTATERGLLPVTVTSGRQPADGDEIALMESTASRLGAHVGDTIALTPKSAAPGTPSASGVTARVVGLTRDDAGAYPYYGGASLLSDRLMATMSGVAGFDDVNATNVYLDIADDDSAAAAATVREVGRLLPKRFTIESREKASAAAVKSLSGGDTDITTMFLLGFGALAMLVGALVIANTFQVLVAQRRRTLALLRAIGARKGQLYASVLFEAGVLGLVASMLGVGLGIALMAAVTASGLTASAGMAMRLVLDWRVFVVPIAFGMVMTIIASLSSARSATAVTPLEALRPIELTDTRRVGAIRGVLSVLAAIGGAAACAYAVWRMNQANAGDGTMGAGTALTIAVAGCALVFLGVVTAVPFWLPHALRGVGALVALAGPSAKVANANIQKNPRRVAATGAALLIGVTLVATVATGAASSKATMGQALASRYSVDMVAAGSDMTDAQARTAARTKGVTASVYAPTAVAEAKTADGRKLSVLLVGIEDAGDLRKVMHADLAGVSIGSGDALMPARSAVSGRTLAFTGGSATFDVKGMSGTSDTTAAAGTPSNTKTMTLTVRQSDYRRVSSDYDAVAFIDASHFTDKTLVASGHMLLMRVDAATTGATLNDVFADVQSAFAGSTGVTVTGPVAERTQWDTMVNAMMALLVGLIAVAVLIALVGVANTLSLSVIERTRESATLRAIGMTRGQLRRSLAVEALLLSLVAGAAGIVLGTGFGWLGSYMLLGSYGGVVFPFDWAANGAMLAVTALAALLASIAPARRAVRTPPVEALAEA